MVLKHNITDIGLFSDYMRNRVNETTAHAYTSAIENFLLLNPDLESINDYNEYLLERVYKKRSYYYYYAILHFIKYKIKDISLRNTLIKNLVKPKNSPPIKNTMYITPWQRDELIKNLENDRHRLIFKIMSQTGARIGDILRLRRNSITYEKHMGIIAMRINIVGKGERSVVKWIYDKELQDEITEWITEKNLDPLYYFLDPYKCANKNKENDRILYHTNYVWMYNDLKNSLKKIGINPKLVATHDFRRSISQDIYTDKEMGKDVRVLQRFLGHARLETTMRYVNSAGLDNKEISFKLAQKYGKVNNDKV